MPNDPLIVPQWRPPFGHLPLIGAALMAIGATILLIGAAMTPPDDDGRALAIGFGAVGLGMSTLAGLAYSFRVNWHIDPVARTLTRDRHLLGWHRRTTFAASQFARIRIEFRRQRETTNLHMAWLEGEVDRVLLTSDRRAGVVRGWATEVAQRLGMTVEDG